ncbi:hypothetical protein C8R44DRAFT_750911 [Mycena epipterygia]|nr:hypothetical protein C8R44DRAFT_750911 [Mycena epipterygia]
MIRALCSAKSCRHWAQTTVAKMIQFRKRVKLDEIVVQAYRLPFSAHQGKQKWTTGLVLTLRAFAANADFKSAEFRSCAGVVSTIIRVQAALQKLEGSRDAASMSAAPDGELATNLKLMCRFSPSSGGFVRYTTFWGCLAQPIVRGPRSTSANRFARPSRPRLVGLMPILWHFLLI